jgi:hypothetical protein
MSRRQQYKFSLSESEYLYLLALLDSHSCPSLSALIESFASGRLQVSHFSISDRDLQITRDLLLIRNCLDGLYNRIIS